MVVCGSVVSLVSWYFRLLFSMLEVRFVNVLCLMVVMSWLVIFRL